MAFKLNKAEEAQLDELKRAVDGSYAALAESVDKYNTIVNEFKATVEDELGAYNNHLGALRQFVENIAAERRSEFDDKSESWQEGETGSSANDWIDNWDGADLDEVTITFPDELTLDFDNHADVDLPSEP